MAQDSIAVVAGGSAGVGLATVEALLARGYRVGILARGQARLDTLAARYGDKVVTIACDVSDADATMAAAKDIASRLGIPKVWVNSAMLTAFSPFEEMGADEFEAITDTTYHGQVNGTRAALSVMGTGNIVNIGSGLSYRPVPLQSAYCGAKHAINGFTGSIRSELIRAGRHIDLSLVQLPAINTPQFTWARNRLDRAPQPAPPIFQPEVAARAVMQAIDTGARELLVGQSVLKLVFGDMVLPAALDRKLADDGVEGQKSDTPDPGFRSGNLDGPADHAASAHGDFDDRASDTGVIVDADKARKGLFFGVPLAMLVLGIVIGTILD